jgi:hypothetical protein
MLKDKWALHLARSYIPKNNSILEVLHMNAITRESKVEYASFSERILS